MVLAVVRQMNYGRLFYMLSLVQIPKSFLHDGNTLLLYALYLVARCMIDFRLGQDSGMNHLRVVVLF